MSHRFYIHCGDSVWRVPHSAIKSWTEDGPWILGQCRRLSTKRRDDGANGYVWSNLPKGTYASPDDGFELCSGSQSVHVAQADSINEVLPYWKTLA